MSTLTPDIMTNAILKRFRWHALARSASGCPAPHCKTPSRSKECCRPAWPSPFRPLLGTSLNNSETRHERRKNFYPACRGASDGVQRVTPSEPREPIGQQAPDPEPPRCREIVSSMKPSRWTEETAAVPGRRADTPTATWAPAASVSTALREVKQKMRILAGRQGAGEPQWPAYPMPKRSTRSRNSGPTANDRPLGSTRPWGLFVCVGPGLHQVAQVG